MGDSLAMYGIAAIVLQLDAKGPSPRVAAKELPIQAWYAGYLACHP